MVPYSDPDKQRAYQKYWMARRRQAWFAENGPCVDCGSWDSLELDHAETGSKLTHKVWSWSEERRKAELLKCVARCIICHRLKSLTEKAKGENNGQSKFSSSVIYQVRSLYDAGVDINSIIATTGVSRRTAKQIGRREVWKHLPEV